MAFFRRDDEELGYATPAALVLCLAVALMASALVARSVLLLRMMRADFEKTRVEYALDGAHLEAAAAVVRSGTPGPFRWTAGSDVGAVDMIAEREGDKLSLEGAAQLDDAVFERFGVSDPAGLRARLNAAAGEDVVDVESLDHAVLWKTCAARLVSPFGRKASFAYVVDSEPVNLSKPPSWRVGEEWRVWATATTGWRDDRIVRFTGDAQHPAALVVRRVSRGDGEGGRCAELLQAAAG